MLFRLANHNPVQAYRVGAQGLTPHSKTILLSDSKPKLTPECHQIDFKEGGMRGEKNGVSNANVDMTVISEFR